MNLIMKTLVKTKVMQDYIFEFRKAVRKSDVIDDNSDFVNAFMFHNNLYGEDIYNELIKELKE